MKMFSNPFYLHIFTRPSFIKRIQEHVSIPLTQIQLRLVLYAILLKLIFMSHTFYIRVLYTCLSTVSLIEQINMFLDVCRTI